eukprot:6172372-Pleurochrysis_carterae.AAC.1
MNTKVRREGDAQLARYPVPYAVPAGESSGSRCAAADGAATSFARSDGVACPVACPTGRKRHFVHHACCCRLSTSQTLVYSTGPSDKDQSPLSTHARLRREYGIAVFTLIVLKQRPEQIITLAATDMLSLLQQCKQQGALNREQIVQRKEARHHAIHELRSREETITKLKIEVQEVSARSAHTAGVAEVLEQMVQTEEERERALASEVVRLKHTVESLAAALEDDSKQQAKSTTVAADIFRKSLNDFRTKCEKSSSETKRLKAVMYCLEQEGSQHEQNAAATEQTDFSTNPYSYLDDDTDIDSDIYALAFVDGPCSK